MMVLARCSDQIFNDSVIATLVDAMPIPSPIARPGTEFGFAQPSLSQLITLRDEYDMVFISSFHALGLFTLLVCKLLGKTCVLNVGEPDEVDDLFLGVGNGNGRLYPTGFLRGIPSGIRHRVLRFVDAFITTSSSVAVKLADRGIDKNIIHTIPISIDTSQYFKARKPEKTALREKMGLSKKATIVVCAGRLDYLDGGLALLLRVWCEIQRQHNNAVLLFVHSGPPDRQEGMDNLRRFVHSNLIDNSVIFAESGPSLADYLRVSDIFVCPRERETFNATLIEAMACELPVVATAVGETSSIIRQGQSGLVVETGDFQQLFEAIGALIIHSDGALRLGRYARQTIEQHYTAESVKKAYERLLCSIATE
jgi:glycosyltransferase involved in cell wall biosynthesis